MSVASGLACWNSVFGWNSSSEPEIKVITPESFLQALNIVRSLTQTNGASENAYQALHELELIGLTKKLNIFTNQTSITNFFTK